MEKLLSLALLLLFFFIAYVNASVYDIMDFHAKADGRTDSMRAFLSAWTSACGSARPAMIYVPPGRYLISRAVFKGPCKNDDITFQIVGTLVAHSNYWRLGHTDHWLLFKKVNGIAIIGGTLDAKGDGFWACRAEGNKCPKGAKSLTFKNSHNILIDGLISIDSQTAHVAIDGSTNVVIQNLTISAPADSPNTDGIHVENSIDVNITETSIETGDDCISIGQGTTNLWIEGISCGPGHGISIGSLSKKFGEAGVQDVTVKNVVFTGSDNGLRIKSWARPSSSFVRDVLYEDVTMKDVRNPIIIDQHYCPHSKGCPDQESGVKITAVTYKNVQGSSASEVAITFDCSEENPCSKIKLQDINLTYQNNPAQAFCKYANGEAIGTVLPESCLQ